jgi:hypothetical protein
MALDNTNASIPLQAGQPSGPFGPDLKSIITMQALAQRMQLVQQELQGQNVLKSLYGNPANVNEQGLLNPGAMRELIQKSPPVGLEMLQMNLKMQDQQTRTAFNKSKLGEQLKESGLDVARRADAEYKKLIEGGMSPPAAQQTVQRDIYSPWYDQTKSSGLYDQNIMQNIAPNFDPERTGRLVQADTIANAKPVDPYEFTTRTDYGKPQPVEYRQYKSGKTTDITGAAPYTPTGIGEPKGAEAQLYEGKADGKDVIVHRGPMGGWLDMNEKPVNDITGLHKVGTKAEGEGKLSPSREFAILDKDGQVVERVAGREKEGGGAPVRTDGTPIVPPEGGRIELSAKAGGGRQAAAQVMAMLNAGNEASASVANLVDLPVTATSGWFKGLTSVPADKLVENVKRGLAGYVNAGDARALQISWQGIGRSLATLEAAGRATGLVGLTKQAEAIMPQKGDKNTDVLRSYAEIRQIVERSVETMKTSPDVSKDQKALMDKIAGEVRKSVPWTVQDINALERGGGSDKTVKEFAETIQAAGAAGGQSAAPPRTGGVRTDSGIGIYQP